MSVEAVEFRRLFREAWGEPFKTVDPESGRWAATTRLMNWLRDHEAIVIHALDVPICTVCGQPVKFPICGEHRYGDHRTEV